MHASPTPYGGGCRNYNNHSALKMHYRSQSKETEDQSPFQGEEGGDEVMIHQFLKSADLRGNEEIPVELPDKTSPINGDELDRTDTSRKTDTSDQPMDQREQRKRGRPIRGSQPPRAENRISSRTHSCSPLLSVSYANTTLHSASAHPMFTFSCIIKPKLFESFLTLSISEEVKPLHFSHTIMSESERQKLKKASPSEGGNG